MAIEVLLRANSKCRCHVFTSIHIKTLKIPVGEFKTVGIQHSEYVSRCGSRKFFLCEVCREATEVLKEFNRPA